MVMKNFKPFGPNKEENIQRVEKGEKVKFPADYREFLLTVGGGIYPQVKNPNAGPEDNVLYDKKPLGFKFRSDGEWILDRFEILYGCLRNGHPEYDIESRLWVWDANEDDYENPDKIIPIGRTQYGNTLVLLLNKKEYGNVGYWDAKEIVDNPDGDYGITILTNTFTEFLEKLNDESLKGKN
ncbi:MAG: SMI1/KNR4 family protein [Ruminococcaceae bacterium]|nr:SMI1/KNR4 family protein [Oscillospiraceae bacterium]